MHKLLETTGFLKLKEIIGGADALVPVCKTTWYAGIKKGIYPKPIKLANGHASAWRVSDIQELLNKLGSKDNGTQTP